MPPSAVHDFRTEPEHQLELRARSYLALVDVESYPTQVSPNADRFDLLQHLCAQTQALTAMMWEVPEGPLRLRFIWAPDDGRIDAIQRSGRQSMANGTVRTSGELCLSDDQELLAAARECQGGLTQVEGTHPQVVFVVPPGIYGIAIYSDRTPPKEIRAGGSPGYLAFLTHHPHPAPRLHPRRFSASLLAESTSAKGNVITSHRRIY